MKKALSVVLALLIACSMCFTGVFAASTDAKLTVKSSSSSANVDDVITVTVDLTGSYSLAVLSFNIVYDSADFEYVAGSLTTGKIFEMEATNDKNAGKLVYQGIADAPITAGGTVLTAQFKVIKTNSRIGIDVKEVYDDNDVNLTSSVKANSTGTTITCAHGTTTWVVTKEATHKEAGVKSLNCTACGAVTKTEPISIVPHSFGAWVQTTAPTCTVAGEETRTCACGEKETRPVNATGHSFGAWVQTTAPTCTVAGEETRTCACGEKETRPVNATGHSFGAWVQTTAPTCTVAGEETRTCACGEKETRPVDVIDHTFGEWVQTTAPTCTVAGEETRTCACGEKETRPVDALGHIWGDWITAVEPSCTEVGEKARCCGACGEIEEDTIDALGHEADEYTVTKEATCTDAGERSGKCSVCDEEFIEKIPALGHSFGDWVTTKEPTETAEGEKTRTCATCGEKETAVIAKLPAQDAETEDDKNVVIPDTQSYEVVYAYSIFAFIAIACVFVSIMIVRKKRCK